MAKGWLRALATHPDVESQIQIVGLVDLDAAAAKALADEFGLGDASIGTDLGAMLDATGADLVFDVVVPAARRAVVSLALSRGCHVLSEKPMAASMEEARELLALAEEAGRIHAIVQNRRYISGVRRMRRFIESGAIGALTAVHCDFFLAPHFGGFREAMQNVLLLDMAIHTFDAARFVSGKVPQSVYCVESNPAGSWYAHGAAANAIFTLSDDAVFTYRGSWCAEGERTSWESAWRLVGSKGMLTWDGEETFTAAIAGDTPGLLRGTTPVEVPHGEHDEQTHGHASVLLDFLRAIETGEGPETVSRDNIRSLSMVFGAIESARTGLPVDLTA
ncbi:putative dehydrogenase [Rhizobium sp. PP-F2F-G38]|nr:putative dehydrogenase [Rhizobium sp. PP-WC-1G-195]PYE39900.1 putative dehydrogenase [Rhizobium sp. PP-F2F-G20b]PYE92266.1 putative dehydrogenase [Rhizobium sp. PP-F2F-G38]TCL89205.1 putative dehydrogenase [Rhizobium sp. PP-WC-2G-219]TCP82842.1 putative dehydrogenase [Rhizobium sp. PP-CC-2G-626]TCQ01847.1 putative dehydrogenase [Rhizobium sp. PP-F2F-G36]TCQ13981.1 putative dehydrogenase [Rhizobium sp. PP-CC-3G-465]